MIIEIPQDTTPVCFGELEWGDPFWDCNHRLLMKTLIIGSENNAVCFRNGVACCIDTEELVKPANVRIVDV